MNKQSPTEQCLRKTFQEFDREELEVLLSSYMKVFATLNLQVPGLSTLSALTLSNLTSITEKRNAEAAAKIKAVFEKFQTVYDKVEKAYEARN